MGKATVQIGQLQSFSSVDAEAIRHLAQAEGKNYKTLTDADLKEMLASPNTYLFVARDVQENHIIGMITLMVYRIPYVRKGYLDDMVVDETYRGQGIGSKLFAAALAMAKEKGAAYVDLTARPRRAESNSMYTKFGFTKRDTNVYRLIYDYGEL